MTDLLRKWLSLSIAERDEYRRRAEQSFDDRFDISQAAVGKARELCGDSKIRYLVAKLPGIRSVMCYFPQDILMPTVPTADTMIGNEVVFDDVAAFNIAMQSPVRQELRRHFREFPPFSGRNTHFAMSRTRRVG